MMRSEAPLRLGLSLSNEVPIAQTIELARARLTAARAREAAASARVGEVESDLSRLRLEQAEGDQRAAPIRERAHARELDINRRQQQQEFNQHQAETLAARATAIGQEIGELEARREPAWIALESRRVVSAARPLRAQSDRRCVSTNPG